MGSQTSPYFEFNSVLYLGLLCICIHETLTAWPTNGQQILSNSHPSWNQRSSYNQYYQYLRSQNRAYPWQNQGSSSLTYNRPTAAPNAYYRNANAITAGSTYPYASSSSYNRYPQQPQWPQPRFSAYMPSMRTYQQANRQERFLPPPSGDRNIPLTPGVMRMLGIHPNGHMMNRFGVNQPYGPDRTVGGITIDGSDISYA